MAETQGLLPVEKRPYKHGPSNPLALLRLLADADAVSLKWPRLRRSDRDTAKQLIEKEPFRARWGNMDWKTLRHWFTAAHRLFKPPKQPAECPEK
jgi:hypothetical protein